MAKIQKVHTADSRTDIEPLVQVQYDAKYNVFVKETQNSEQPESISNTCVVEKVDSNVILDSPDMCDNDIQTDQNAEECDDERVALANLIANLTLDIEVNKKILKQLKKANASLTQELKECKSNLDESNTIRDSCLITLQSKQTELETYMTLIDRTVDYDKLELVKEKHDELVKQSFLTKSHYEGLVKEKTKVIMDLKLREEKDIDKTISMEKQLKFLNEIVYKRNQSIQTIPMLAPKGSTFNGRPTFANPMHLKKAQSEKTCLYEIPYDTFDPANRSVPDREETLTLEKESRSKLNKDLVKPYDYTKQNSLYENFKPTSQEYHEKLAHANEIVQLVLFIVNSGCTKHMTGNITINMVYYVEGLNHRLVNFVIVDLEVAFQKSTCFVRDLQGNDLLTDNHGSDLYTISLQETTSSTPICFMAKASPTQAWLWHRRLSHLNFDYINLLSKKDIVIGFPKLKYVKDQLCSSCEVSKAKRSSFKTKVVPSSKGQLNFAHIGLIVLCVLKVKWKNTFW
ncbi:retrovirus-related pol polyprotein from transposon TNT 1-94 [Tanacetum coccineum]